MSQQYPGGFITKNPVVPSGPYQNSTASGVWTLDQAAQYVKANNWPTSGNLNPDLFIENLFSPFLYTGNGSTQTITNGIDLSGKGGLVWMKGRSGATDHALYDTVRGATKDLASNTSTAETTQATGLTAFSGTGFSIGALAKLNTNTATYASWTFREQAKFFDIVTYTGDGSASPRQIAHSLGSVPGFIVIKRTDTTSDWTVWHRSVTGNAFLQTTDAWQTGFTRITTPDSTTFTVGASTMVNASGGTYVAYIFAHNAGGFGLSGTDNVISCGSYTGNGSATGPVVTLGWEPQWVLVKRSNNTNSWYMVDTMRGFTVPQTSRELAANTSAAEAADYAGAFPIRPLATGFQPYTADNGVNASGDTYIYIAIRRGPMKVPTSGTSVFSPVAYSGANGAAQNISAGFPVDADIIKIRNDGTRDPLNHARLMGGVFLKTDATSAEASFSDNIVSFSAGQNVIGLPVTGGGTNEINGASTSNYVAWAFRRAPGFFDVVCYTGTGANLTLNHNLGIAPELMIFKSRNTVINWRVAYGFTSSTFGSLILNLDSAGPSGVSYNTTISAQPTATTFSVGSSTNVGVSGGTYVAYLFATVAGVSKVGSYTGNGSSQTIACGFTAGSRFVMIKRTDLQGDWYVWDSARGIVAGNDPYLRLNSTAAEVTTNDSVDTDSTGFVVNELAATNINVTSATYIFLAIA